MNQDVKKRISSSRQCHVKCEKRSIAVLSKVAGCLLHIFGPVPFRLAISAESRILYERALLGVR